jgi:hypothetical protein
MKCLIISTAVLVLIFGANRIQSQLTPDDRNIRTGTKRNYEVFGDLSPLENQKTFHVVVMPHIEKMGVAELPDSVYIATRVSEWNAEEPGNGDRWLSTWNDARVNFKPMFIAGMNESLMKSGVDIGPDDSWAEYTLTVITRHLMEWWTDVYVILDVRVTKTSEPENEIALIRCPVNYGARGGDYTESKYEQAYYTAGFLLGKYLVKAGIEK